MTSILLPYQLKWVADPSPRKVAVKSRRVGFTFITSYEEVCRAMGVIFNEDGSLKDYNPDKGVDQYVISSSLRQAISHLAQCAQHVTTLDRILGFKVSKEIYKTVITLANGRSIFALPPNPRTIRGDGGDVTIDEAGVVPNPREVYRAAHPITGKHIGRAAGYRMRVVGSPCGDDADNLLYRMYQTTKDEQWSRHHVDIYEAIEQGFPADVAQIRSECMDDDEFEQEYNCAFLSSSSRYISAELWDSCVYHDQIEDDLYQSFAGYDVARRPSGDLAALVELVRVQDKLYHVHTWAQRGVSWDAQEGLIADTLQRRDVVAVDATGIGMQFGERLKNRHGSRVMPIEFTNKSKEQMITGLKLALEKGRLKVMPDGELRRDVLSLQRQVTNFGNVRYDAKRTGSGHADRAWALAMAVHASGGAAQEYERTEPVYQSVKKSGFQAGLGGW